MFLGNEEKVYVLDKAEGNPAQIDGHPAWGSVWDIKTKKADVMDVRTNVFCASGMHLPNGSFVTFGGNSAVGRGGKAGSAGTWDSEYQDFDGAKSIRVLNPCTSSDSFASAQCKWFDDPSVLSMNRKRWYSTAEPLADGSIVLIGGFVGGGYINRNTPDTTPVPEAAENSYEFHPDNGRGAQRMQFLFTTGGLNAYAHAFMLNSGKMLVQANVSTIIWDYNANIETPLPDMPNGVVRVYPASGAVAMLPLTPANNYNPTILFCGGSNMPESAWGNYSFPAINTWDYPASKDCQRLTPEPTDGSAPAYEADDDMLEGRTMSQFIILPDGKLLVINGGVNGTAGYAEATGQTFSYSDMPFGMSLASGPVGRPAIYDPNAPKGKRWSNAGLDTSPIARMYHSTAILLPDASVLVAGSNPNVDVNITTTFPTEYRAEIFYPPYFAAKTRPTPKGLPETISYGGDSFNITIPSTSYSGSANDAAANTTVVLIRGGFTTHAMNMGQRYLQLNNTYEVKKDGSILLHVAQAPNPNVLQPGPALLYVTIQGIPSNGTMVIVGNGQMGPQPTAPPSVLPASIRLDSVQGAGEGGSSSPGDGKAGGSSPSNIGLIVGIAAGVAGGVALIAGLAFWFLRRRSSQPAAQTTSYAMTSGGQGGFGGFGMRGSDVSGFAPLHRSNDSEVWTGSTVNLTGAYRDDVGGTTGEKAKSPRTRSEDYFSRCQLPATMTTPRDERTMSSRAERKSKNHSLVKSGSSDSAGGGKLTITVRPRPPPSPSAPAEPWKHPDELEYIRPDWSRDTIIAHLRANAFSVPPRMEQSTDPWCSVTSVDGYTTVIPKGYRLPLMFAMRFQWQSLRLVVLGTSKDCGNDEWDFYKFDILHVSRMCRVFLEQAREATAKNAMDRHWRCAAFDRLLTRYYRRWLVTTEEFVKDFFIDYDAEEYERDAVKNDWQRWVQKGHKGFRLTKEETLQGLSYEKETEGLFSNPAPTPAQELKQNPGVTTKETETGKEKEHNEGKDPAPNASPDLKRKSARSGGWGRGAYTSVVKKPAPRKKPEGKKTKSPQEGDLQENIMTQLQEAQEKALLVRRGLVGPAPSTGISNGNISGPGSSGPVLAPTPTPAPVETSSSSSIGSARPLSPTRPDAHVNEPFSPLSSAFVSPESSQPFTLASPSPSSSSNPPPFPSQATSHLNSTSKAINDKPKSTVVVSLSFPTAATASAPDVSTKSISYKSNTEMNSKTATIAAPSMATTSKSKSKSEAKRTVPSTATESTTASKKTTTTAASSTTSTSTTKANASTRIAAPLTATASTSKSTTEANTTKTIASPSKAPAPTSKSSTKANKTSTITASTTAPTSASQSNIKAKKTTAMSVLRPTITISVSKQSAPTYRDTPSSPLTAQSGSDSGSDSDSGLGAAGADVAPRSRPRRPTAPPKLLITGSANRSEGGGKEKEGVAKEGKEGDEKEKEATASGSNSNSQPRPLPVPLAKPPLPPLRPHPASSNAKAMGTGAANKDNVNVNARGLTDTPRAPPPSVSITAPAPSTHSLSRPPPPPPSASSLTPTSTPTASTIVPPSSSALLPPLTASTVAPLPSAPPLPLRSAVINSTEETAAAAALAKFVRTWGTSPPATQMNGDQNKSSGEEHGSQSDGESDGESDGKSDEESGEGMADVGLESGLGLGKVEKPLRTVVIDLTLSGDASKSGGEQHKSEVVGNAGNEGVELGLGLGLEREVKQDIMDSAIRLGGEGDEVERVRERGNENAMEKGRQRQLSGDASTSWNLRVSRALERARATYAETTVTQPTSIPHYHGSANSNGDSSGVHFGPGSRNESASGSGSVLGKRKTPPSASMLANIPAVKPKTTHTSAAAHYVPHMDLPPKTTSSTKHMSRTPAPLVSRTGQTQIVKRERKSSSLLGHIIFSL
ncbi:hypothetical protein DXG03_002937 [Asterophora parasitica]|uniref:Galactose oxidase n=1 Tax=Asterophora parasitica TaxID=117018 RepID=A0A9P7G3X5_9AGAR|nr:hypothetical protein DXG03_002937 [Asterophora parasitica]